MCPKSLTCSFIHSQFTRHWMQHTVVKWVSECGHSCTAQLHCALCHIPTGMKSDMKYNLILIRFQATSKYGLQKSDFMQTTNKKNFLPGFTKPIWWYSWAADSRLNTISQQHSTGNLIHKFKLLTSISVISVDTERY